MAKRVNTKFLIGLTASVGGLAVLAFGMAIYYTRHHHNAAYYMKRADADAARQDWQAAIGDTGAAIARQRSNTALYVQLAGFYERIVDQDPVYLAKANQAYRAALEVDPAYTPAIDHLLAAYVTEMKLGVNTPAFFTELKNIAEKGKLADSGNVRYQLYSDIADLQQGVSGLTQRNPKFDAALKNLLDIAAKHPEESDAAYYASQAEFKRARDLWTNGQTQPAGGLLDQIAALHAAAVKARPNDPAVQLRAAQVLAQLAVVDPRGDRRARWQELSDRYLAAAYAAAKPADDVYDDVQTTYAARLRARKSPPEEVLKALNAWTAARPHDQRAVLELAGYTATLNDKRADAVKLLEAPVPRDPDLRGYPLLEARRWDRARLIALDTFRVQDASVTTLSRAQRLAILAPVDADLDKIASMGLGEDANLLKLRGKVQMLHGNPVEAIKSYERAQTLLGSTIDLDLWMQLRLAYHNTGQSGTEQKMMEDLLNRAPGAVPIRIQLAELYLNTQQFDRAADQLKILKATQVADPKSPADIQSQADITRLDVELRAHQNQGDVAREEYAKLPDTSRQDRLLKARMAVDVNESAEGIRLYRLMLHDNPADQQAVVGAVNLYLHDNNIAQAQQVVADARNAEPKNEQWKMLAEKLAANTPEAIRKFQDQFVQETSDPLLHALRQAQLAMERGQWDEASQQLTAAEKLKPDDNGVLIARIQWCVLQRKFDEAAPLVDRAAAANADQMNGLMLRTRFALTRGDPASAVKYGTELVGKHNEFALNWLLLARAQQMAGSYGDAVTSCDAAIQRQPNNVEALKIKAACFESLGRYPEEKAAIAEAARLAPEDVLIRDLSLNFELHHGDADGVVARCEQILKNEPQNPAVYVALGQACEFTAQSKYRGDATTQRKLYERARDVLTQGMSKFADTPDAPRFYGPLSVAMDGLGDVAGAEDLLKKYAARPDQQQFADASRELARFYERHNRLDDAQKAWQDAWARSSQNIDIELEYSQFLLRRGKYDPALSVLASANPSNPRVQNQKIETLMGAKKMDDALKLVDEVYGPNSQAPAALYYRGLISLTAGDGQAAVTSLSAARDKDPQNPAIRVWLASALLAQNRRDDAAAELVDVLQRNPLRDDARVLLLDAYSSEPNPRWQDFDQVVREAETNPVLAVDPAWHQIHARGLSQRGRFAEANNEIAAARKLAPDSFVLWDEYVNLLVRARDWQHVLEETHKQLEAGHKQAPIFGKRGIARAAMGDKAGAAREFEDAFSTSPPASPPQIADLLKTIAQTLGPDEALAQVGNYPGQDRVVLVVDFLKQKGDIPAMINAAESGLAQGGLTADQKVALLRAQIDGYLALSQADKANPKWDKARRAMDQLLGIQPDDMLTLNNAAYLLCQILNDPKSARPYSKRAYDIAKASPQPNPAVIDTHGWILTLCGGSDADQGLLTLRNLVDSNPTFTKARYHLCEAYIRQGRLVQASDQLKVVQDQIKQMQENHSEIDSELTAGVAKAAEEIRQKSGRASG